MFYLSLYHKIQISEKWTDEDNKNMIEMFNKEMLLFKGYIIINILFIGAERKASVWNQRDSEFAQFLKNNSTKLPNIFFLIRP